MINEPVYRLAGIYDKTNLRVTHKQLYMRTFTERTHVAPHVTVRITTATCWVEVVTTKRFDQRVELATGKTLGIIGEQHV